MQQPYSNTCAFHGGPKYGCEKCVSDQKQFELARAVFDALAVIQSYDNRVNWTLGLGEMQQLAYHLLRAKDFVNRMPLRIRERGRR